MNIDEITSGRLLFTKVSATSDGDNTVIAAVTGRRILVVGYSLYNTASGSGVMIFKSGTTEIGRLLGSSPVTYSGPGPAFRTAAGEALVINNDTGDDTFGHMTYVLTA
jgi:hypothetical protein